MSTITLLPGVYSVQDTSLPAGSYLFTPHRGEKLNLSVGEAPEGTEGERFSHYFIVRAGEKLHLDLREGWVLVLYDVAVVEKAAKVTLP